MAFPALSALAVYPVTVQTHFGIPGSLPGMLIESITPNATAKVTAYTDENTNPAVRIYGERVLDFEVKGMKKSRTTDPATAYPGVQIDSSSLSWIDSTISQGQATSLAGRIFILEDPKVELKKAELDSFSFKLVTFGYTLSRFAS